MRLNATGQRNVGIGTNALTNNVDGDYNIAQGYRALAQNNYGSSNIAVGDETLYSNTSGTGNVAVGDIAMHINTTGNNNTAIGNASTVSVNNLVNATAIGAATVVDGSNKVRIGNTSVTSIGGQVGWTTYSDARFKKNIKNNVPGLDFINMLKPITYTVDVEGINQYQMPGRQAENNVDAKENSLSNPAATTNIQSGFLARDVAKAAKQLGYDFSGVDVPTNNKALYGLRYADFVVPLVKAMQELQAIIQALEKRLAALESK